MNTEELKKELNKLKIPENFYSINEKSWLADAYILQKNYYIWEFYYVDERGGKNDYKTFKTEDDACEYMLEAIKKIWEHINKGKK